MCCALCCIWWRTSRASGQALPTSLIGLHAGAKPCCLLPLQHPEFLESLGPVVEELKAKVDAPYDAKQLAQLLAQFLQFQEDALGIRVRFCRAAWLPGHCAAHEQCQAMISSCTRLPVVRLLDDPLAVIQGCIVLGLDGVATQAGMTVAAWPMRCSRATSSCAHKAACRAALLAVILCYTAAALERLAFSAVMTAWLWHPAMHGPGRTTILESWLSPDAAVAPMQPLPAVHPVTIQALPQDPCRAAA